MKGKMRLFSKKLSFNKSKWINIMLSVVALVQVVAILMITSYAWVETASTIIISSDGDQPIDTFVYTNAEIDQSKKGVIDLSKYYRASGNIHMASAFSGDGRMMYFPRLSSTASVGTNQYRPGEVNDKNTNYVSFNLKIKAKGTAARFTFESDPIIKINGSVVTDNSVRVAVSCGTNAEDTTTKIFSKMAAGAENQTINGNIVNCNSVLAFSDYLSSSESTNTVFEIPKDQERTVTITIWLHDVDRSESVSVDIGDLRLVPPGTKMAEVKFVDKTSRYNDVTDDSDTSGWGWTDNDNHTMWVYDIPSGEIRQMTKSVNDDGYTEWIGQVQISSIEGGGTGNLKFFNTDADATSETILSGEDYICRWDTSFSELKTINPSQRIYTAYANFINQGAKTGYGTWGAVTLIRLDTDESAIPAKPTALPDAAQAALKIINTSRTYPMNYQDFDNDGTYCWQVFIPKTERTEKFILKDNETTYSISAIGRDTSEDRSTFRITYASGSGSTATGVGYWEPPAIVNVELGNDSTGAMGAISVSGGVPGSQSVKVTAGTNVNLIASGTGDFGFYGWYTLPDCSGDPISRASSFSITAPGKNETVTYYAKFERLYSITLVSLHDEQTSPDSVNPGGTVQINDGTKSKTQTTLRVFADSSPEIKAEAYISHEFLGWFASSDWSNTIAKYGATDAQKVISSSDIIEGNGLTLFARYSIKTFTIEAEARYETLGSDNNIGATGGTVQFTAPENTASNATASVTVNYNGTATFKANEKSADGYEFVGWYLDPECITRVHTGNSYSLNNITENKKLYAKFNLKTYTVTAHAVSDGIVDNSDYGFVRFVVNGSPQVSTQNATLTTRVKHGAAISFQAYAPSTKSTFGGWFRDASCLNQYINSDDVTIQTLNKIALNIKGNTDLYAKFTPKTYYVTAHAGSNGQVKVGTNSYSTTTSQIEVNAASSVTFNAQANSGYQFAGWYTSSAYTTKVSDDAEYTEENITGNLDRYAKFEVIPEITIYYYNANNWTNVNIYCWTIIDGTTYKNAAWPAEQMTNVGGKVWSYTYNPSETWATNMIFNNGSGSQTGDLTLPTADDIENGRLYYKDGSWVSTSNMYKTVSVSSVSNAVVTATYSDNNGQHTINEGGSAQVYAGTSVVVNVSASSGYQCNKIVVNSTEYTNNPYTISSVDANTTISATIGTAVTTKTVYFQDEAGWGAPKIHIYKSGGGVLTEWNSDPTMTFAGTNNGKNVYKYTFNPTNYDTIIFHKSSGSSQTKQFLISQFSTNNCLWYKNDSSCGFFTFTES